jgi:serine/threonine protein phosphatase PrpC
MGMLSGWVKAYSVLRSQSNMLSKYLEVDFDKISDVGRIRKNNEDYVAFFVPKSEVGGAAKGEVASRFAAETVIHDYYQNSELPPKERLICAFKKANQEIYTHSTQSGQYMKMATTLVAAVVFQNQLIIANVGDSRAYLIHNGEVRQISRDHSVVAEMVRDGSMSEEEASTSKIKNRLSRSIGGEAEVVVDVYPPIAIHEGDRILLCSDGLTRYANPGDILSMASSGAVEDATQQLVKFTNKSGGVDNTTVLLMELVAKSRTEKNQDEPPSPIPDWQTADTVYTPPEPDSKKIISYLPYTFGILFLFLIVVVASNYFKPTKGGIIVPWFSKTIQPTKLVTPLPLPFSQSQENIAQANASGFLKTSDKTPLPVPSVVPDQISKIWECIYMVKDGNTLETIIRNFGEIFDPNKDYYLYENCVASDKISDSYETCMGHNKIDDPGSITVGKFLIVYSSVEGGNAWGVEKCTTGAKQGYTGKKFYTSVGEAK